MVAPSFQSMTVVSEVYIKDGKAYIDVRNEKTGTIRHARWYTEAEYHKAYGNKSKDTPITFSAEEKKFYMPAAVRSIEVSGTNPRTLKAHVAASSLPLACAFIWQAYGAKMQSEKGV